MFDFSKFYEKVSDKTLQIEVGKTYLSRDGREFLITGTSGDTEFPFLDEFGYSYTDYGGFVPDGPYYPEGRDLISEVVQDA